MIDSGDILNKGRRSSCGSIIKEEAEGEIMAVKDQKEKIDASWRIGEVLKIFPETMPVFEKFFGETCLEYPGASLETIEFGSITHSLDVEAVLDELNERIAIVRHYEKGE